MKVLLIGAPGVPPIPVDVSAVVVTKDDGTPFMAAGQLAPGLATYASAHDAHFPRVLAQLGYDRTVIVQRVKTPAGR